MPSRVMVIGVSFCAIALFATGLTCAQPSGEEILKNIETNFSGIEDYTVSLDVNVDIERLKVPRMQATLYFKQPDKVHLESKGFALLPRDGIALNPRRLMKRFTVISVVEEQLSSGNSLYKLVLAPREDRSHLREMTVYVDRQRSTIDSVASLLTDRRAMTAMFVHTQVSGHWLPERVVVRFSSPITDTTAEESSADQVPPIGRPGMPRTGTILVRYFDYRLNTGLRDDIFVKPDKPKQ